MSIYGEGLTRFCRPSGLEPAAALPGARFRVEVFEWKDIEQLPELLKTQLQDNDMVITQGAGNIGVISRQLAENPLFTGGEHDAK